MSDRVELLLARVERLEKSNRAMKFFSAGAILFAIAFSAAPAISSFPHGPKRIDAQSFNLVTHSGQLLATLQAGPNGGQLAFFDTAGKPEMVVGGIGSSVTPTLGVGAFDGNAVIPGTGKARMIWAMSANSLGEAIFDPDGNDRIQTTTDPDGSNAGTFFFDANQKERGGIGLGANGPGVFFNDSTGVARILEGVLGDDSAAAFSMNDANGNTLTNYSAKGDDSATSMQILDASGTQRVIASLSTGGGEQIILKNASNSQTFHAP